MVYATLWYMLTLLLYTLLAHNARPCKPCTTSFRRILAISRPITLIQGTTNRKPEVLPACDALPPHAVRVAAKRTNHLRLLVIAIVLLVVTKEGWVLSAPEILFETTFGLRVGVASAAEEGKENGKENEGVCRGPENEGGPYAEVVYFENLQVCWSAKVIVRIERVCPQGDCSR
jgi:hypothetical protein